MDEKTATSVIIPGSSQAEKEMDSSAVILGSRLLAKPLPRRTQMRADVPNAAMILPGWRVKRTSSLRQMMPVAVITPVPSLLMGSSPSWRVRYR